MKKKLCFMLFLLAFALNLNAQNDSIIRVTKYIALESQKGVLIKFMDKKRERIVYNIPSSGLKNLIRTCYIEGKKTYFLVLDPPLGKSMPSASIEYSDLVEINKAIDRLFKEVDSDCAIESDYLENTYISEDGFKIGYYVEKDKPTWVCIYDNLRIIKNSFEIKKPYEFAKGLKDAQHEIEKMRNEK